jgi:hypothetical protein
MRRRSTISITDCRRKNSWADVMRALGRNDPCWCGSGEKYKKCHLAKDERAATGSRRPLDASSLLGAGGEQEDSGAGTRTVREMPVGASRDLLGAAGDQGELLRLYPGSPPLVQRRHPKEPDGVGSHSIAKCPGIGGVQKSKVSACSAARVGVAGCRVVRTSPDL